MTRRAVAALAICTSAAVLLAACSSGTDDPAVLAPPTPRGQPEMSAEQLKQATDALVSDRDQLNSAAQANAQANPPQPTTQPATTGGSTQAAGAAAKP